MKQKRHSVDQIISKLRKAVPNQECPLESLVGLPAIP